ncbi:MAG: hypothetical protein EOM25_03740 [Deltaproteobacteria bacterium]|nr:hypothetical protein [Deltaproteobacteria bacterium]
MTNPAVTTAHPERDPYPLAVLQDLVGKLSVVRLVILILLMIPVGLQWIGLETPYFFFKPHRQPLLIGFFLAGYGLSLIYLLTWDRFSSVLKFLTIQLWTDVLLTSFLVWMTGGIQSGFAFFFLVIVFLYGRLLGFRTATLTTWVILAFLVGTGLAQARFPKLWTNEDLTTASIVYMVSLQSAALALVTLLVKLGRGQERYLLARLLEKEKALDRSERLKSHILDWMESGLILLDAQHRISAINAKALEWAGLARADEAVHHPITDIYPFFDSLWAGRSSLESNRREIVAEDGETVYGVRMTKAPDDMDLIIFMDITSLKRLERKVAQMEKMAAVGELSAGLAHEIKNPLASIRASLQLLADEGLEAEYVRRLSRLVTRDVDRLNDLLKDFLVFARPVQGERVPVQIGEAVRDALNLSLIRETPGGLALDIEPAMDRVTWLWDPNQLQQVLINLFLNASQAVADRPKQKIRVTHRQDGEASILSIEDTGPGFESSLGERPFTPFFTTKATGTGLGLAIAQRLAGQNDSVIDIGNVLERGSIVGARVRIHAFGRPNS